MRTLRFYGASDDRFEIEGSLPGEPDELGCYKKPCVVKVCSPSKGQLAIVGMYAPGNTAPCWSIGIMPVDEDVPIPPWQISWQTNENGYSTQLTILVPDDAVVSEVTD